MPPTSSGNSNPLITSLYLLSPSLTALSYQSSNVCAYCNTAFRMTSDLVYHMRSHHKRTKTSEEIVSKNKLRDDQLRCHICQETFRERHHLTRHMTSHQ
ncbi:Krueppel-like factor 11-like [Sarcoptes scabiei]|nr:Krueppel-like factor 11-like [Sarcoptes scabiei]